MVLRRLSALYFEKKMKRKVSLSAAFTLVASLSLSSVAQAGFFEDLFGGPDPAPQAGAAKVHSRSSGRRVATPSRSERVNSEIRFMPTRGERSEERRTARAREDRSSGSSKVALVDTNQFSAGSRPVQASLCMPQGPDASNASITASNQLLYDKTLRAGDVLVTDKGVQVFHGQKACPHDATSFVALSSAGVSKSRRSVLLAIQDAMNRPSGYMLAADQRR